MSKLKTITLYFSPEDYAQDMGDDVGDGLTAEQMLDFAKEINDVASHFIGYTSWEIGEVEVPADDEPTCAEIKLAHRRAQGLPEYDG